MNFRDNLIQILAGTLCIASLNFLRAGEKSQFQFPPQPPTLVQASPIIPPPYGQLQREKAAKTEEKAEATPAGQPGKFNKASNLIGMEVQNGQGEKLGDIKELVVDLENGKVSYAVLGAGGVLGLGEKLLAVPLMALKSNPERNCLILQADKQSITQAQGMGSEWPAVENPTFGAEPFWNNPEPNNVKSGTNAPSLPRK